MDGLREYQRRRLELGDMLRAALHVARNRADEQTELRARRLLARLAEDQLRLAVVGQFSRGKSTLMNAILGGAYLPTGDQPMTQVVTTVRYGSRPRAWYRRRGFDTPIEAPLGGVAEFVARSSSQRAELQVSSVDIEVAAEILRLGVAFIDTPGVGSTMATSTATTRQFLPQADAVIYVTGFDSAVTDAEAAFLAEAARHVGKVFLVVNKRDLVSIGEASDALELMRQRLPDELRQGELRVFALSALQALHARTDGDPGLLAGSGLPPFEAELVEFLTGEKAKFFLRTTAARAARLVAGLRRDLLIGGLDSDGTPIRKRVAAEFETRMADLRTQQRTLAGAIAHRFEAVLPEVLSARCAARRADLRASLQPCLDEALADDVAGSADRGFLRAARDRLQAAGEPVVDAWIRRHGAETHETLMDAVADEVGELLELSRSPGVIGADIAGMALPDDRSDLAAWSIDDVPGLAVPRITWSVPLPAARWTSRRPSTRDARSRERLRRAIEEAGTTTDGHAVEALQRMARSWAQNLSEQTERRTSEAADRFRRNLRTPPDDEDLTVLDDLVSRLDALLADLDSWKPSAARPTTATEAAQTASTTEATANGANRCAICDELASLAFDQLRQAQFRLATREDDQIGHARTGGFCPLHTWQYAAMASPLGVSAGYAKLAESVADALETLGNLAPPGRIEEVARSAAGCPVCTALDERERDAVSAIAANAAPSGDGSTLCLRHLAQALAARPAPDTGRALLRSLSVALRRDAQDMRAYALKREGLRGHLATREESHAYL